MSCEKHNWLFMSDCPKCTPEAIPDDDLDIPEFLKVGVRDAQTVQIQPQLRVGNANVVSYSDGLRDLLHAVAQWSDAELVATASDPHLPCRDRQPVYEELRRRDDRRKTMERIAKMKEKL